jgi:endonuclease YncB( thermonuclease family)
VKINSSFVLLVGLGLIVWGSFSRGTGKPSQTFPLEKNQTAGQQCTVKAGSIYDGDTLRVFCNGEELKLRLCGIDAPEKVQVGGMASRNYLRARLPDNSLVRVHAIEKDRYGRTVAEIFLGETFINAEMVRESHAWHYQRYSGNCPNRSAIVEAANNTQLTGMPPWEFRKGN